MFCFHTPILPYPQKFQQPFVPFCFVLAQSLTGLKTIPFVLSCVFLFTKRPWFQYTNAVLVTPLQQQPFVSTEMGGALQRSSNSKAGQRERPVRWDHFDSLSLSPPLSLCLSLSLLLLPAHFSPWLTLHAHTHSYFYFLYWFILWKKRQVKTGLYLNLCINTRSKYL